MRLVIASAWYPVCVATYLLRAALRAGHEVVTVGPGLGDVMPWEEPVEFPGFGIYPDIGVREDGAIDALRVRGVARWSELWIDVDGGWALNTPLPAVRRVAVVTDPHVPAAVADFTGAALRPHVARVYVMQSSYGQPGDGWLPYGFDPVWHQPANVECDADVTNLGAPYEDRVAISDALTAAGLRVLGPGRSTIGPAYARELCRAPVAVVWPMADDLPARVFEALACARWVITRDVPDLRVFNGQSPTGVLGLCRSVEDTIGATRAYAAARLIERPAVHDDFLRLHTWDARLAQLIGEIEAP